MTEMASVAKRRFSCRLCTTQVTEVRNLKTHYLEIHNLVQTVPKQQIFNDVFGLDLDQLRRLSSEREKNILLLTSRRRRVLTKRRAKVQAANETRYKHPLADHSEPFGGGSCCACVGRFDQEIPCKKDAEEGKPTIACDDDSGRAGNFKRP